MVLQHYTVATVQPFQFQRILIYKGEQNISSSFSFLKALVNEREIKVEYCRSDAQLAGVFTKSLGGPVFFKKCRIFGSEEQFDLREALLE